MRVDIGSAVFVGDAVSDVIASKRAGSKVIGLYKDAKRMRGLIDAGADLFGPLEGPAV